MVHPHDRERVRTHFQRIVREGVEYDHGIDYRVARKSGREPAWIHIQGEVIRNEEGEPKRFFGTIIEVTDRKKLEAEIRAKYDEMRRLFDAIPEALFTLRFEKGLTERPVFVDVNKGASKMFHASSDHDWIGKSPADISPPVQPDGTKSLNRIMDASARVISGESMDFEWVHRRFDGGDFDAETSLRPYDTEGERRILAIVRDITQRKTAQKALEESACHMRAIVETAQDAIILVDNRGRVRYWNPSAERIFGYGKDEILGEDMAAHIVPDEYRFAHMSKFAEFQKNGKGAVLGKTVELRGKKKNGEEFPMELSLSSMRTESGYEAVAVIRDISERKTAEKTLLDKNAELQKAIKLIIGREKKMIEMKEEMKRMKEEIDRAREHRLREDCH